MIRIDDERGGDVVFVVNSFLSGNRMGKRSTKGGARRASLFISSESGPNPALLECRSRLGVGCMLREGSASGEVRTSNSGRFPGIGEKVMQERSEMRFLHHFLRGRRVD